MVNIKKVCYIVGACEEYSDDILFNPNKDDFVIAADGGYDILKRINITPDVVLGDFDSIKTLPKHPHTIKYPTHKDYTDTFLAYKTAFENDYRNFVIFGGVGGRIDHTMANIQTLLHIAKNRGRAFLIGKDTVITTIYNARLFFSDDFCGNISIFAHGGFAENVTIRNLKYSVEDITLNPDIPLGVSNEFIGERAEVSVGNGALLIMWNTKCRDLLKKISDFLI